MPQKKRCKNEYEVNFDIPIIYEDDDLIVLNKPPQIVVHQAPSVKEATLVEWLNKKGFMLSNLNGDVRAGIVHRLDKGTSGAIVVAKNNFAHAKLSEQLSDKSMGANLSSAHRPAPKRGRHHRQANRQKSKQPPKKSDRRGR